MRKRKPYNSGLHIGDKVVMIDCLEAETYKDRIWVTRSEPWLMDDGCTELIMLEGFRGGFSTEKLRKVGDAK